MTQRSKWHHKGRRESGSFLMVPHAVLHSPNYIALSAHAVKLLFDMAQGYTGKNNGDLCAAWKLMKARGWRSKDTLNKALKELVRFGMLELTRQGGMHKASLYGITWKPIDECGGKLDLTTGPSRVASSLWRKDPQPDRAPQPAPKLRRPVRPAYPVSTAGGPIATGVLPVSTVGGSIAYQTALA